MLPRPLRMRFSRNSLSSLTELAVGLGEPSGLSCCALAGTASAINPRSRKAPTAKRMRARSIAILVAPSKCEPALGLDLLLIGRQPAPGPGAVTALRHPVLVDIGD